MSTANFILRTCHTTGQRHKKARELSAGWRTHYGKGPEKHSYLFTDSSELIIEGHRCLVPVLGSD